MGEYRAAIQGASRLPGADHRPRPGTVEIRLLHAAPEEIRAAEQLEGVLSSEERQRADAFLRDADRALYLVSHVGLRLILGRLLGLDAAEVELGRAPCPLCDGPHGRPEVPAEPPLHFSLSHAREYALCGVAADPVGVDLEAAAGVPGTELVPTTLHPAEQQAMATLPEVRRPEAFLHCWVRKEAYLKGLGTGLGTEPATVDVGLGPVYGGTAEPSLGGWSLATVPAPPGYAAAAALRHPGPVITTVRPFSLAAVTERSADRG